MRAHSFEQVDSSQRDLGTHVHIYCPGCKERHSLRVRMPKSPTPKEVEELRLNKHGLWAWNGDTQNPTFTPSLVCNADYPEIRCHSQITDGNIHFYGDSFHELKDQTVPLPDLPE